MYYVCSKSNPLSILYWGNTIDAGGLGSFDSTQYQEVGPVESLPTGWVKDPGPQSLQQQLIALYMGLSEADRTTVAPLMSQMKAAIDIDDEPVAKSLLNNFNTTGLSTAIQNAKTSMLAIMP